MHHCIKCRDTQKYSANMAKITTILNQHGFPSFTQCSFIYTVSPSSLKAVLGKLDKCCGNAIKYYSILVEYNPVKWENIIPLCISSLY